MEETTQDRPAEQAMKPRRTPGMSVYIGREVGVSLGGYSSNIFRKSILCWARVLEQATLENAKTFEHEEWALLSHMHKWSTVNLDYSNLKDVVCEVVMRSITLGFVLQPPLSVKGLLRKVARLDYTHAAALVWALQWREASKPDDDVKWYTLEDRRVRAAKHEEN